MLTFRHHYIVLVILTISLTALISCGRSAPHANDQGNQAFAEQDYPSAIDAYKRAQQENPNLPEPYYNAGNTHYRQQMFDDAISSYDQGLVNASGGLTADTLFNLGNVHFTQQAFDKAIDAYKEALRLNSADPDAKYNLELALLNSQTQDPNQNDQPKGENQESESQEAKTDQEDQSPVGQQTQPYEDNSAEDLTRPGQSQNIPLNEEQARQLLKAISDETRTLQEHLQMVFTASTTPPRLDW